MHQDSASFKQKSSDAQKKMFENHYVVKSLWRQSSIQEQRIFPILYQWPHLTPPPPLQVTS